jgi:ferredoxin
MFYCVDEWDPFERNLDDRKADLTGSERTAEGVFVRPVSEEAERRAELAARVCPMKAIRLIDADRSV